LREGSDGLIIAIGVLVNEALLAAEQLEQEGSHVAVIDARFIKPLDRDLIISQAEQVPFVITAEENSLQGGFGSSVLEMLSDVGMTIPVTRVGIPDKFVGQGTQPELRSRLDLDAAGLVKRVKEAVSHHKLKSTAS
jgi:1-deoxy-D-xylulose-5-phosphate synthase